MVPATDLGVFTVSALPLDRLSFKQFLGGCSDALERVGLDPFETLERTSVLFRTSSRTSLERRLGCNMFHR